MVAQEIIDRVRIMGTTYSFTALQRTKGRSTDGLGRTVASGDSAAGDESHESREMTAFGIFSYCD